MSELRFSRIALFLVPIIAGGVVIVLMQVKTLFMGISLWSLVVGTLIPFSMLVLSPSDLLLYLFFLAIICKSFAYFSLEMKIALISLANMLYCSLYLWYAYFFLGMLQPFLCGTGEPFVISIAQAVNWRNPNRDLHGLGMILGGVVYGILFYALIALARKTRFIKPEVTSEP